MPILEAQEEAPQATVDRVRRAVVAPIEKVPRTLAVLVAAAGAGSYAPDMFGAIVAMACVVAAWDLARKR
jgi:hypothetical protein